MTSSMTLVADSRSACAGRVVYQHAPFPCSGHGAESKLGPSWAPDGLGGNGLRSLGSFAQIQSRVIPSGPTATASFSQPDMDVHSCTLCFTSPTLTCRSRN